MSSPAISDIAFIFVIAVLRFIGTIFVGLMSHFPQLRRIKKSILTFLAFKYFIERVIPTVFTRILVIQSGTFSRQLWNCKGLHFLRQTLISSGWGFWSFAASLHSHERWGFKRNNKGLYVQVLTFPSFSTRARHLRKVHLPLYRQNFVELHSEQHQDW